MTVIEEKAFSAIKIRQKTAVQSGFLLIKISKNQILIVVNLIDKACCFRYIKKTLKKKKAKFSLTNKL